MAAPSVWSIGMTAIFELPLPSETLNADEIAEITGAKTCDGQRSWLDTNRWKYHGAL